ncbi:MAG: hypothetical protein MK098_06675 [Marinovum sp.]|nr:hypothetical protein [Marinovum sp.]
MQTPRMCGVVLWSSIEEGRAIIWCEDHGDLAFYHADQTDVHLGGMLDAGDLIDFDVDDDSDHRLATNPRLLVEDHAPRLPQGLRHGTNALRNASEPEPSQDSNVIRMPKSRRPASQTHVALA